MNIRKMQQLEKLGFDKDWLDEVKLCFQPKKRGKYRIKIYDIEDLSMEPEDGVWIDTTCFNTALGLSFIHYFFEGNAYVMSLAETGYEIGRGIIDGAPFEEVEEYENEQWDWISRAEIKKIIDKQKAIKAAKPTEYIRKPKIKEGSKTEVWIVLEANNCDTDIWTSEPFKSKDLAQKHLRKRYKENINDLGEDIIEEKKCTKDAYSILTYGSDYFYGVIRSINI